jgi:hypothetical protein
MHFVNYGLIIIMAIFLFLFSFFKIFKTILTYNKSISFLISQLFFIIVYITNSIFNIVFGTRSFLTFGFILCIHFMINRYRVFCTTYITIVAHVFILLIPIILSEVGILNMFLIISFWIYFHVFFMAAAYKNERDLKKAFLRQTKLRKEFRKSKQILNILLPDFVRERIRSGQRCIQDD